MPGVVHAALAASVTQAISTEGRGDGGEVRFERHDAGVFLGRDEHVDRAIVLQCDAEPAQQRQLGEVDEYLLPDEFGQVRAFRYRVERRGQRPAADERGPAVQACARVRRRRDLAGRTERRHETGMAIDGKQFAIDAHRALR